MISTGQQIMVNALCPSCGEVLRVMNTIGTDFATVCCRNKRCKDANVVFVLDRIKSVVTEVLNAEVVDGSGTKTHTGN